MRSVVLALAFVVFGCEPDSPAAPAVDVVSTETVQEVDGGTADAAVDTGAADIPVDTGPPPCNAITQAGCEPGEKCAYGQSSSPECTPAGTKALGEECAGVGDCLEGSCMNLSDTGNYCYKYCKTELHCGYQPSAGVLSPTGECVALSGETYKVCGLDVTYVTCDLFQQDCEPGKGCYWQDSQAVCLPAGSSGYKGDCDGSSDCAPGFGCINHNCLTICDPNATPPCTGTFTPCVPQWGPAGYCDD